MINKVQGRNKGMKKKLVVSLLSLSMALSLLVGCGSSSSNQQENETLIESESTIETTEASTIEESSIVDETIEESSVIESEESSVYEETSTTASNETSMETTTSSDTSEVAASTPSSATANDTTSEVASNTPTNETPIVESQVESVVETTTTTSSLYSVDECVSIIKSTLISAGYEWYPDSDEYKECCALYPDIYIGPDGGMGWGIDYVDMSDPYSYVNNAVVTFKHNRWESFYFEVLGVSNGQLELKAYSG
jgi:hypothetical protein